MSGDIAQLQDGLTGLRRWLQGRGFTYINALLRLPDFAPSVDFFESPRLVAYADEDSLAVLFFSLYDFDAEREERLCKHFRAYYPRSLCFFTASNSQDWDVFCSPLEDKPPYRVRFDPVALNDRQERFLDCLTVAEDDALTAYRKIVLAFAAEGDAAKGAFASSAREKGLQESVSWWLSVVGKYPLLSEAEERRLVRRVAQGDASAREALIMSNLRLVVNIARKYQRAELLLSDLIQAGNIGLIHAVEKNDWLRGYRFSTYATYWIKQAIGREIENTERLIRYPSHLLESLSNVRSARESLERLLGRSPSADELAARLNETTRKVREWLSIEAREMSSLDAPVSEGVTPLGDFLPSAEGTNPEHRLMTAVFHKEVKNALSGLKPRERDVLQMRCGLGDSQRDPMTLEDIGNALEISRERARQIQEEALRKLRYSEVGERLKETVTGSIKPYKEPPSSAIPPTPFSFVVAKLTLDKLKKPVPVNRAQAKNVHDQKVAPRNPQQKLVTKCDFPPGVILALEKRLKHEAQLKDVAQLTREELLGMSGVGQGKVNLIVKKLAEAGLSLRREGYPFVEVYVAPPDLQKPFPNTDINEVYCVADQSGQNGASLSLFCVEEILQATCQNCGEPVTLRPTIGGKWYRCKKCKDTRVATT